VSVFNSYSVRRSIFGLAKLLASLLLLLELFVASTNAQTNSTWNGGTGNWSDSGNWNPVAVPNNSGSATYDVTIGVANSNVTMDILNDTINNLTLEATDSLTITDNTLSLVSGASLDSGTITNTGGIFNNDAGASLTISGEFLDQYSFNTAPTLNNAGKMFLTADGGIVSNAGNINNSGTLTKAGNLDVGNSSINNSGTLTNASGGNLFVGDEGVVSNTGKFYNYGLAFNEEEISNNLGGSLINYGTIINFFDAATVNYGRLVNTSGGTINDLEGNLINHGTLINAGTINNSGGLLYNYGTLNNAGMLLSTAGAENFDGLLDNYGTLNNSGTLTISSGTGFVGQSTLNNYGTINNSGMLFNTLVGGNGGFPVSTLNNFGTLNNSGTITNTGTFTNSGFVNITSSGLFTTSTDYTQTTGRTIVNGTLTATGSSVVNIQHGILSGGGTINGNVLMGGTMIAGTPGDPRTMMINGNYEQSGGASYEELINGTSNGLLDVSGLAKLDTDAFLKIALEGGFDPSNGTSYTIVNYGSESGGFVISDPFFNHGSQKWVISSYDGGGGNDIVLTAEANAVATTPEPGTRVLV
jgi:hypothetical protein